MPCASRLKKTKKNKEKSFEFFAFVKNITTFAPLFHGIGVFFCSSLNHEDAFYAGVAQLARAADL